MNIVIIGFSGVGKSTLIQKLVREKNLKVRGYISAKIESPGDENGIPIFIMPIPKNYKGVGTERIGVLAEGHPLADTEALDRFARNVLLPLAQEAKEGDILMLDEIGVLESKSELFKEAIDQFLDGPATVVAAVREKHTEFLDHVKNHPQNTCFYLTEENRDEVYKAISRCFG